MRNWAGVHLLASDSRGLVALMRLLRDQSAFGHEAELQNVSCLILSPDMSFGHARTELVLPAELLYDSHSK